MSGAEDAIALVVELEPDEQPGREGPRSGSDIVGLVEQSKYFWQLADRLQPLSDYITQLSASKSAKERQVTVPVVWGKIDGYTQLLLDYVKKVSFPTSGLVGAGGGRDLPRVSTTRLSTTPDAVLETGNLNPQTIVIDRELSLGKRHDTLRLTRRHSLLKFARAPAFPF